MRQVLGCTLLVLIGLGVSSCGSSTEIPTVAEDPWAPPEAPAEDAGWDDSDEFKPPCGNGGMCDPRDLGGETCPGLGMGDGTLACDPVTCTYDTSMCEGSTGMGNGGNGSTGMGNNGSAGMGANQNGNGNGNGNGGGSGQGNDGNTPQFFGGAFFGGDADGGTGFFGGGFFGGGDGDGGTGFFGGGFFGGNSFGGGNNNNGGDGDSDQDPMDAGI